MTELYMQSFHQLYKLNCITFNKSGSLTTWIHPHKMTSQTFLHKLPSTGTESRTKSGYCDRSFPCRKHAHSLSAQTSAEAYSQMLCDVVLDQDECLDKVQEIGILFKKAESQLLTGGGYGCCVDRRYGGGDKGGGGEIRSDVIAMPLFHSISHSSWVRYDFIIKI